MVRHLQSRVPGYEVDTWVSSFPELKQTMDMKTGVMGVFGVIMLCVAAIGIFNSQMMAVFERTREIGILGALGFKPRGIMLLFLLEGTLVGALGALLWGRAWHAAQRLHGLFRHRLQQFCRPDGVHRAHQRADLFADGQPLKVLQHGLTVLVIATLAALLPARDAARREAASALHHV